MPLDLNKARKCRAAFDFSKLFSEALGWSQPAARQAVAMKVRCGAGVPPARKKDTRDAWLKYQSEYPHVSAFFRSAPQYKNQISIAEGKKAGTDINLNTLSFKSDLFR
jgi:hypothetical protein